MLRSSAKLRSSRQFTLVQIPDESIRSARFARPPTRRIKSSMTDAIASRSTPEARSACGPKTASREIFQNRRASRGRSAGYRSGASRDFAYAYEKARRVRQFLQTDPIGRQDDVNLNAYVRNDPLNNLDPAGSITVSVAWEGEATGGEGRWRNRADALGKSCAPLRLPACGRPHARDIVARAPAAARQVLKQCHGAGLQTPALIRLVDQLQLRCKASALDYT